MAIPFQVTFDAHHPPTLAEFWALALQYVLQPPPPGYATWDAFLDEMDVPGDMRESRAAIVDPQGEGPRVFFQQVPEGKTAKNRVHLDVSVSGGPGTDDATRRSRIEQHAALLEGAGATVAARIEEFGEFWIVMHDPEGNEFCVT
ncbi:MAG: VOC family protein [Actinobacteria bacterium]|nr:VOC family protein [Actinomycetota bacterium]